MIDREYFKDSRPWRVNSGMIETMDGTPIAHMDRETGNGTSPTERDQNAHLIVEACNAHSIGEPATREEVTAELARIEYSLADIREVLKLYPTDPAEPHAYVEEKLKERDTLLTRWTALEKKLAKLEKAAAAQYENPAGTLEGHRAAMQALDPDHKRRVYRVIIDLENDATQNPDGEINRFELCTILEGLAERVQAGDLERTVQDTNGNSIGQAEIIETAAQ